MTRTRRTAASGRRKPETIESARPMHDFDRNDRAAIEAALNDPDPGNPIAVSFAELLTVLGEVFAEQAQKMGGFPSQLRLVKPRTAFDDIVLQTFVREIADITGVELETVWVAADDDA
jgi:hypothetical protein